MQHRGRGVTGVAVAVAALGGFVLAGVATAVTTQTKTITVAAENTRTAVTPACPPSQGVISGGFKGDFDATAQGTYVFPLASTPGGADRWSASAHNYHATSATGSLSAYAYCSDAPATERRAESVPVGADDRVSATASCPRGTRVVSGGFEGNRDVLAYRSRRTGAREWTAWGVSGPDGAGTRWKVFALCRDGADLETRRKSRTVTAAGQAAPAVGARCRRGEHVVSGGFSAKPVDGFDNGPEIVSSYRVGGRRWRAEYGISGITAKLTSYAYCQ